jgi:hypothetical protein
MSSKTLVLNTTHIKPVLSIENFENMTLTDEEFFRLINECRELTKNMRISIKRQV